MLWAFFQNTLNGRGVRCNLHTTHDDPFLGVYKRNTLCHNYLRHIAACLYHPLVRICPVCPGRCYVTSLFSFCPHYSVV